MRPSRPHGPASACAGRAPGTGLDGSKAQPLNSTARQIGNTRAKETFNPNCPIEAFPIVGASLLAKFFASKLAPTVGSWPNGLSGFKGTSKNSEFAQMQGAKEGQASRAADARKWGFLEVPSRHEFLDNGL